MLWVIAIESWDCHSMFGMHDEYGLQDLQLALYLDQRVDLRLLQLLVEWAQ